MPNIKICLNEVQELLNKVTKFVRILNLTLVMLDPYRSGFTMHVCVADHGLIRYPRYVVLPYNNF